MPDTKSEVNEYAHGTEGLANIGGAHIKGNDGSDWYYDKEYQNPYQKEHDDLFAAIRSGAAYCEADNGAYSTLTSILGRMATYSGLEVSWEQALNSDLDLSPANYDWGAPPPVLPDESGRYPVPIPGKTKAF
jgi:hypothetical protein